jgi:hypothetical protein
MLKAYLFFGFVLYIAFLWAFGRAGLLLASACCVCMFAWCGLWGLRCRFALDRFAGDGGRGIGCFGLLIIAVTWWLACTSTVSQQEILNRSHESLIHTHSDGTRWYENESPNPAPLYILFFLYIPGWAGRAVGGIPGAVALGCIALLALAGSRDGACVVRATVVTSVILIVIRALMSL